MSLEQEIRAEIENIKKLKMEVGNINNHLSALEGLCRKDKDEAYQKGYDAGIIACSFVDKSDTAYQKGFEDGKNNIEKRCDGCRYESKKSNEYPCCSCARINPIDQYAPMPKDEFCFGDEVVDGLGGKGIVVSRNNTDEMIWVLIKGRIAPQKVYKSDCRKTGAHCDIDGYFEEI